MNKQRILAASIGCIVGAAVTAAVTVGGQASQATPKVKNMVCNSNNEQLPRRWSGDISTGYLQSCLTKLDKANFRVAAVVPYVAGDLGGTAFYVVGTR